MTKSPDEIKYDYIVQILSTKRKTLQAEKGPYVLIKTAWSKKRVLENYLNPDNSFVQIALREKK